jgi:hypothetical protein
MRNVLVGAFARQQSVLLAALTVLLLLSMAGVAFAQEGQTSSPASTDVRTIVPSVNSDDFPLVDALLYAQDANGLPVSGLSAADLVLVEDATLVSSDVTTLVGESGQPLQVALTLDRSTDPATWAAIQASTTALIDQLGDADEAALIVFGDEVQVVQDFTTDHEALRSALAATPAGGNFSALNLAVQEALDLMSDRSPARRSVTVIADRADNLTASEAVPTAIPSVDDLASAALSAGATLDIFGYGLSAAGSPQLTQLAELTNGRRVFVALTQELAGHLQALPALQRQGYRLSYLSQAAADGDEHELVVALGGRGLPVTVDFAAQPSPLQVAISQVADQAPSDGQEVSGSVFVGIEAQSAAPVASVIFDLDDGQIITSTNQMVGGIVWDATQTPAGEHTLTVTVEDTAGNVGQDSVRLTVVPPLTLAVAVADDSFELGQNVVMTANLESFFGDTVVEAFVGTNMAGMATNPTEPVVFQIATDGYDLGRYALVVRARDGRGYSVVDDQHVLEFTPAVAGRTQTLTETANSSATSFASEWVEWGPWLIGPLLLILLAWLLFVLARRMLRRGKQQAQRVQQAPVCRVLLTNTGNMRSRYSLRAEEPSGAFEFRFGMNGVLLQASAVVYGGQGAVVSSTQQPVAVTTRSAAPGGTAKAPPSAAQLSASTKSLAAGATKTMATASVVVEFLAGLASFLPARLGAPLQQAAGSVRRRQVMVQQTQTQVALTTAEAKQTVGAGRELAGTATKVAGAPTTQPPINKAMELTPVPTKSATQEKYGLVASNGAAQPVQRSASLWVETPVIAPGETAQIDIHVTVNKRLGRDKRVSFRFHSRSADQENAPVQVEEVSVELPGKR